MNLKLRLCIIILIICTSLQAQSVFEDVENTVQDLVFISEGFITPGAEASSFQSSAAWVDNAHSLGLFETKISLHFNTLFTPSSKRSFEVSNSDFNNFIIRNGSSSAIIPSALGGETSTFFDFTIGDEPNELQAFEGVQQSVLFHPFLQASVGLWKKTEVTLRYSPRIPIEDAAYNIYGIGLKHNLNQYSSKEENPESLQYAIAASYARFDLSIKLDAFTIDNPDDTETTTLLEVDGMEIASNSMLFQLITSKKLKQFEFMGNLGITVSDYDFSLNGQESQFLSILNQLVEKIDTQKTAIRGEIGVSYHFSKWSLSHILTVGRFTNSNLAVMYRL
ncbi:DUF6588 family protein [Dokdonia donghaensis]|uniref:Uncharacterized protein n=1 Tax=Dokdonia donghaensis DSW-1 TaxID=1300343 RepID=A0A0A2GZ20_9FLAO|nr:DUF6588 family protein [Dokdonia donghaensis]ANH60304.1 hypothetical protein I597_1389 [Dokdonia donghaensis DSW-1]KGO07586.1 hypothetical protein NV36_12550 [Dokdonia donghaensis DSW-1]